MLFSPVLSQIPSRIFLALAPHPVRPVCPVLQCAARFLRQHSKTPSRTLECPLNSLFSNFFRMNTCKSVSKQRALTPIRIRQLGKTGGRGWYTKQPILMPSSHIFTRYFRPATVDCRLAPMLHSNLARNGERHDHSTGITRHPRLSRVQDSGQARSGQFQPQMPVALLPPRLPHP